MPGSHSSNPGRRPPPRVLAQRYAALAGAIALIILIAVFALRSTASSQAKAAAPHPSAHRPAPVSTSLVPPGLPGMPPVLDPQNIYSAAGAGELSPAVQGDIPMVYVPNGLSNTVTEIDPTTYKVVRTFPVGGLPQHVVPSYDMRTLWVTNDKGNSLTPIDPKTGLPGTPVPVEDPYNMYFTPDGKYAIVVAEALQRLDFRNAQTMALVHSLPVPCPGVDHLDFSADGTYLIASCEFGAKLIKVNVETQQVVGQLALQPGAFPQDVKLAPNGKTFYVADMTANGVHEVDGANMTLTGFIPTGSGAHGLYLSRDSQELYVSNRNEGSVSVVSVATNQQVAKWWIPGGGSPDMGNVTADGKVLWLSGRYDSVVYAFNTTTGALIAKIPVGDGPHGLCVWPQPGRYSIGHTGITR